MRAEFVKKIKSLPTLPTVLTRIIHTLDDPKSSARDLEAIISNDQSLTTKLLAVANSPYYGFRHEVTTVRRAVVAVGFNEVRNICLGLSLTSFLHPATFRDQKAAEQLWLHVLAVAEAATLGAGQVGEGDAGSSFTAGLLHDIGKVVLGAFMPDQADEVQRLVRQEKLPYLEAERQVDASHEEVGRALAEVWDLPPLLSEVIGQHHHPDRSPLYPREAALVHVADALVRRIGLGDSGNPDKPEILPAAMRALDMDTEDLARWRKGLESRQEAVESLWRMLVSAPGAD